MLILMLLTAFFFASTTLADTDIPVGSFRSVELSQGGRVVVRHGAVQRVTVADGDERCMKIRLAGERLLLQRAPKACPGRHRVIVEVVTPHLSAVSVSNGGTVQLVGTFPAQESIRAAVEQGGKVDIRAITADDVDASVYSGGGILATARKTLAATVDSGGAITYWGEVTDVKKSVHHGGVVQRGRPEDADEPLSELDSGLAPVPPVPPVPPRPPAGS